MIDGLYAACACTREGVCARARSSVNRIIGYRNVRSSLFCSVNTDNFRSNHLCV